MKPEKNVLKGIVMISQVGFSAIVPIFLCVFVGKKLDAWLGAEYWTVIWLILGILAAFRNIYVMTKQFYAKDKMKEDAELKYLSDMKKEREARLKQEKK